MKFNKRIKLKTILFTLSSLLTISSVSIIAGFSYWQSSDMLIQEFEYRSDIITRNFAYQAFEGVIVQDSFMLDRLVEGVLLEKNLIYALIFDAKGRLIFKKYKEGVDDTVKQEIENLAFEKPALDQTEKTGFSLHRKTRCAHLLDNWQAVIDRDMEDNAVGYIRLGISLTEIESLMRRLLFSYAVVLFIILFFGLLLSFLVARNMSRSQAVVIEAMRDIIHDDNLSVRLSSHSRIEETNTLISYFNKMISQLMTSRHELSESEEKFRKISSSAHDAIIMVDDHGRISYWNRSAEKIFGFSNKEIMGTEWNLLVKPDSASREQDNFSNFFENAGNGSLVDSIIGDITESVAKKKDGTFVSVELSLSKVKLQNQMNTITILRDISKRKETEEELKESQQRMELAIQAIDAGLWDWNIETDAAIFSDRWATMLEYEPEEITNHISSWNMLLHPEDSEQALAATDEHFAGKTSIYKAVFRMRTKSGGWKWIQSTGRVVSRDPDGKALRAIGTHIDIDKRKINEIELAEYRMHLEDMVAARTQELKNAQTELVNKAIESGRAQLSAMILHNIGNAMTPVGVQVEDLQKDKLERISNYLEHCYQDLQNNKHRMTEYVSTDKRGKEIFSFLGKLIKSIKDHDQEFSTALVKISEAVNYVSEIISLQQNYAARDKENKQLTDLNRLLDDALIMQSSAMEKRDIVIKKETDPNLPMLTIDKNKLMQVVVNLIKNAYEAIDELNEESKEKVIAIKSFKKDNIVGFEIDDTGVGIQPDKIETILKFGESGKGSTGFGLYYCKMFVEANKGKLIVNSPGKGEGASIMVNFEIGNNASIS